MSSNQKITGKKNREQRAQRTQEKRNVSEIALHCFENAGSRHAANYLIQPFYNIAGYSVSIFSFFHPKALLASKEAGWGNSNYDQKSSWKKYRSFLGIPDDRGEKGRKISYQIREHRLVFQRMTKPWKNAWVQRREG
ncbi:hypothetical protein ACFLFF_05440 [Brevibacillus reuszeri]|uniref:hypothetical protein n=1 Tax=Brevibacillus reuszeri TaxID=54915 RepID=UPI001BB37BAE|nr:hypothetical protein [Brevibacillus reuszeri]